MNRTAPALLATALSLVAGCAVGPDFKKPAAPDVARYTPERLPSQVGQTPQPGTPQGEVQHFVQGLDLPGQWWELFHSPALNAVIERALAANPTLEAAQASLRQARETTYAQTGALLPSVSASYQPSANKTATGALAPVGNSTSPYYDLQTAQLSVSFVPDVFGGTRRQIEDSRALAEAQRYQLEATYLTLTSNGVAAAVQEASLRGQIEATQEIIAIETHSFDLLQKQRALGGASGSDVLVQQAALASAIASLPPLQKQLAVQRDLLSALTGRLPSDELPETFTLSSLTLPSDLPVSLPSSLVEQRPDILQAEANLHSASAQIGVAEANRLPQITLSALVGTSPSQLGGLFAPGNGFFTLGADVAQPIFEGGALLHKQRAAEANFDQVRAQYRNTVITAFQNVADSLRALQADADALNAALTAEHVAAESLAIARSQQRLGQIGLLTTLTVQQTYQQALMALVQAKASRLADTAALFQALGGGWWNRQNVTVRDYKAESIPGLLGLQKSK
jgi:NodT family efflux transporter outer membrane factor (OMF) lipoprotein